MSIARKAVVVSATALALVAVLGVSKKVEAQSVQICTFTNDSALINYGDGYHRDSLTFSWNNSTGAVTAASWTFDFGGGTSVFSPYPSDYGTVAPGFVPNGGAQQNAVHLKFTNISPSNPPLQIDGILARRVGDGQVALAAIQTGSSSAWMGGYGTVSCASQ